MWKCGKKFSIISEKFENKVLGETDIIYVIDGQCDGWLWQLKDEYYEYVMKSFIDA